MKMNQNKIKHFKVLKIHQLMKIKKKIYEYNEIIYNIIKININMPKLLKLKNYNKVKNMFHL